MVSQEYWDRYYDDVEFKKIDGDNPIKSLITRYVKPGKGNCIEIGCYPGSYLAFFGDMGYTLNGIDLTPRVEKLPGWLLKEGYPAGQFFRCDFREFPGAYRYDVVCSFGFIEHFEDWGSIIEKHAALADDGGYVIITAPNFDGTVQRLLHLLLDEKNLGIHVAGSMDPASWSKILESLGFTIVYCGYFGGFKFWAGPDDSRGLIKELTAKAIYAITKLIGGHMPDNKSYSTFCGVIARRR